MQWRKLIATNILKQTYPKIKDVPSAAVVKLAVDTYLVTKLTHPLITLSKSVEIEVTGISLSAARDERAATYSDTCEISCGSRPANGTALPTHAVSAKTYLRLPTSRYHSPSMHFTNSSSKPVPSLSAKTKFA